MSLISEIIDKINVFWYWVPTDHSAAYIALLIVPISLALIEKKTSKIQTSTSFLIITAIILFLCFYLYNHYFSVSMEYEDRKFMMLMPVGDKEIFNYVHLTNKDQSISLVELLSKRSTSSKLSIFLSYAIHWILLNSFFLNLLILSGRIYREYMLKNHAS